MQKKQKISKIIQILGRLFLLYLAATAVWRVPRFFDPKEPKQISVACRQAILQGEDQINQLSQVKLQKSYWDYLDYGYDTPAHRPRKYQYILENTSGMRNVFSSPLFLTQISQNIIEHCSDVSLVGFSDARFAAYKNYGLYPSNEVKVVCRRGPLSFINPFGGRNWRHEGCD